jgi:hypothetical protein
VLTRGVDGHEAVAFPPPGRAVLAGLARLSAPAEGADVDVPLPHAATGAAPSAPPAPSAVPASGGGGGGDIDEIYDQVIERLRRELLADRERMGDLLGDLP